MNPESQEKIPGSFVENGDVIHLDSSWLGSQPELGIAVLHDSGLPFRLMHSCELKEPGEFVGPDSIVLLTGLTFAEDPGEFRNYVEHLVDSRIVGIGFGVGFAFDDVPHELIDATRAANITLFTVPRPVPFVAITAAVARAQERKRQQERAWLLEHQTKSSAAAGKGLTKLLDYIGLTLGAHVGVIDGDGRVHGVATLRDGPPLNLDDMRHFVDEQGFGGAGVLGELRVLTYRMQGAGERTNSLFAASPTPLGSSQRLLLQHCAGLADLLLQRPSSLRRARLEINALAMAIQLGIERDSRSIDSVFHDVADTRGEVRPLLVVTETTKARQKFLADFERIMEMASRFVYALPLDDKSCLILLRGDRSLSDIKRLLGSFQGRTRIIVGSPLPWQNLDKQVIEQLRYSSLGIAPGEVAGTHTHLLQWANLPEIAPILRARSAETWGRLCELDRTTGSTLVDTLEAYLNTSGHITKTAEQLNIHRHTLTKRLHAIESALEISLDEPLVRAELLVSAAACSGE